MSDLATARRAAKERADFSLLRQRVPYAAFLDVQVTIEQGEPRQVRVVQAGPIHPRRNHAKALETVHPSARCRNGRSRAWRLQQTG